MVVVGFKSEKIRRIGEKMPGTRILVVTDNLDLESIIRGLITNGVPADRLHVTRSFLTEEMAASGVVGDLPRGKLEISSASSDNWGNGVYDGVTGTWNGAPVREGL